jgi:aromatic ring-cleaving dioxygenase
VYLSNSLNLPSTIAGTCPIGFISGETKEAISEHGAELQRATRRGVSRINQLHPSKLGKHEAFLHRIHARFEQVGNILATPFTPTPLKKIEENWSEDGTSELGGEVLRLEQIHRDLLEIDLIHPATGGGRQESAAG